MIHSPGQFVEIYIRKSPAVLSNHQIRNFTEWGIKPNTDMKKEKEKKYIYVYTIIRQRHNSDIMTAQASFHTLIIEWIEGEEGKATTTLSISRV